jgi:hypothetical protein
MNKVNIIIAILCVSLISVNSIENNCDPACGGSTEFDCADFKDASSSPDKCYSCAAGFVGGSGSANGIGATCRKGTCPVECAACKTSSDPTQCYLCSFGFYDPVRDPTKATPCSACHSTCQSCRGPKAEDCLICNPGFFDTLASPYLPGTCDPCDTKCSQCQFTRDNCVQGCCSEGFKKESQVSYKCVIKGC